jgi:AcrR family transcriptional regulator
MAARRSSPAAQPDARSDAAHTKRPTSAGRREQSVARVGATRGARPDPALQPEMRQPAPELGPRAQRTIARILDATKEIFLSRGYGGTTIDDIAKLAGVSRASFYTYFPTKRDALLALGADAARAANVVIRRLANLPVEWTVDDLAKWVHEYFEMTEDYGSFGLAWTHAAHEDEAMRQAGMSQHLAQCRRIGLTLDSLRGYPVGDPTQVGLLVYSMLEGAWSLRRLYGTPFTAEEFETNAALVLAGLLRLPEHD